MDTNGTPKIEKGIPPPVGGMRNLRGAANIFREMAVGDSVFLAGVPNTAVHSHKYIRVQKELGVKFTARAVEGGVRVWRIA